MKKFLLGTLGLVAMVAPAFAADLPVKAPPPMIPPMFNWSVSTLVATPAGDGAIIAGPPLRQLCQLYP
jgi:hypothetical protein